MEAAFCVDCLEDALRVHGKPEVFNSDQGVQFTSEVFTGVLKREEITISMDGRGRAYDNIFVERLWRSVKHENVYLNGYATMGELLLLLTSTAPRRDSQLRFAPAGLRSEKTVLKRH